MHVMKRVQELVSDDFYDGTKLDHWRFEDGVFFVATLSNLSCKEISLVYV